MAATPGVETVVGFYDRHPINEEQILTKLAERGVDLDHLTEDILQEHDQDHFGGLAAVDELATAARIDPSCRVLDVCSGIGGPARYLAHRYRCRVTGLDLHRKPAPGGDPADPPGRAEPRGRVPPRQRAGRCRSTMPASTS